MSETLLEIRSSRPAVICKIKIVYNLTNFPRKHLRWSSFFVNQQFLKPTTALKRTLSLAFSCEFICDFFFHFLGFYFRKDQYSLFVCQSSFTSVE